MDAETRQYLIESGWPHLAELLFPRRNMITEQQALQREWDLLDRIRLQDEHLGSADELNDRIVAEMKVLAVKLGRWPADQSSEDNADHQPDKGAGK